mmetsp:Transcript_7052/g.9797  ORF Transcript_7052/g.9797 Transcript_7052/m.9797 type:complete len:200 (+) Transcript_7052:300-899(+)|eukprot:CAMPEP_0184497482 /NCGR_PEP_ID=MMETSP0113_2-20130426/36701_1 /TAXON_ID=91329 /ORGANISM="Norrisiella sphaerica, Strain BC52" /LENGTH=199 /DNA_ID=CAMNT_0026884609 /DNA_START=280 /DNA_END=879 /DNA_ORIENTATION=-
MSRAQPIMKNTQSSTSMGGLAVAHSCPTFGMVPPRPPSRRPLKAKIDPPSLLLPSSPMFETEVTTQASENEKVELSRSLSNYSGFSCPQGMSSFLSGLANAEKQSKFASASTSHGTGAGDTKMSSSPTVFELLKRRARNGGPSLNEETQHYRPSLRTPQPQFNSHSHSQQDDLSDMLQFDLSLDTGNDGKEDTLHPGLA